MLDDATELRSMEDAYETIDILLKELLSKYIKQKSIQGSSVCHFKQFHHILYIIIFIGIN